MIRTLKTPRLLIFLALVFCLTVAISAQDEGPPHPPPDGQFAQQPNDPKPDLMRELALSREQIQAIRRLNVERKPVEMEARRRFRDAVRELDLAIYSDSVNDDTIRMRLKEFQSAQGELARIKFTNELAVRKLLTPEQLVKFRDMLRKFAESRENMEKRRDEQPGQPGLRPFRRGNKTPPIN